MRLTCLKTGQQFEIPLGTQVSDPCNCGDDTPIPDVYATGTFPNERAAERSRSRAFRAAGLVKNLGGFALGIALLGILFFPLGIVGAAIGVYSLTMIRGPVARYSGRREAVAAVIIGVGVFLAGSAFALNWMEEKERQHLSAMQDGAREDLKRLLRAQRLHRASTDAFGTLDSLGFKPAYGEYTIYLSFDDRLSGYRNEEEVLDPLPEGFEPTLEMDAFTAVAVANIDDDPYLDVWILDQRGPPKHVMDDIEDQDLLVAGPDDAALDAGEEAGAADSADSDGTGEPGAEDAAADAADAAGTEAPKPPSAPVAPQPPAPVPPPTEPQPTPTPDAGADPPDPEPGPEPATEDVGAAAEPAASPDAPPAP